MSVLVAVVRIVMTAVCPTRRFVFESVDRAGDSMADVKKSTPAPILAPTTANSLPTPVLPLAIPSGEYNSSSIFLVTNSQGLQFVPSS